MGKMSAPARSRAPLAAPRPFWPSRYSLEPARRSSRSARPARRLQRRPHPLLAANRAAGRGRPPAGLRRGRLRARRSADPLRELSRVSQPGQAQGRPVARHLRRRARRRQGWRRGAAGPLGAQPDDRAGQRRPSGDRMPLDELPLSDEQIALLQRWIDQGARATPTSAAAPAPWEAPLALEAPVLPAVVWPAWSRPADRLVASYLAKARVPQPALVSDATFARRAYLDIWGLLPPADDLRGVRCRRNARQARTTGGEAAGGRQEVRRALDFLLERSAAQRGRPDVFLRTERTKEHHRLADGVAGRQQAVRPVRARSCSIRRSRAIPRAS